MNPYTDVQDPELETPDKPVSAIDEGQDPLEERGIGLPGERVGESEEDRIAREARERAAGTAGGVGQIHHPARGYIRLAQNPEADEQPRKSFLANSQIA